MAKQTINLASRNRPVKRTTTSNYVNFNQLGKSKAQYTTAEFFKGRHGKLMLKVSPFEATNIKDFLVKLNKTRPGKMGEAIAQAFNPEKNYKAKIMGDKAEGKLFSSGAEHPTVNLKGAKVKRLPGEMTTGATAEDIVNYGNEKLINEYGQKTGKLGRQVRELFEQNVSDEKNAKSKKAASELLQKVKEKHNDRVEQGLTGVSNIFGGFMRGVKGN